MFNPSDPPPPDIEHRRNRTKFFYNDAKIIITAIITVTILICSSALMIICLKYRKILRLRLQNIYSQLLKSTGQRKHHRKEATENLKKAEVQRDRYYATIHKVPLHPGDKIPGNIYQFNYK